MTPVIHIINGPNLNLIGSREPQVYGTDYLLPFLENLKAEFTSFDIRIFQSNHEGELIDYIQKIIADCDGIMINPAAYTHTSVAIRDALRLHSCPIIEVHLSDPKRREEFRHHSMIRDLVWSHIEGLGVEGYRVAMLRMAELVVR
ncbi:MAG: type II 3-dehydroquinate dehydratase [Saprospiraceae bacterium]